MVRARQASVKRTFPLMEKWFLICALPILDLGGIPSIHRRLRLEDCGCVKSHFGIEGKSDGSVAVAVRRRRRALDLKLDGNY